MDWLKNIWQGFLAFLEAAGRAHADEAIATVPPVVAYTPPEQELPPIPAPPTSIPVSIPPAYYWDTPSNARHSVRVICDEEGLTVAQKNDLCATIECESGGFNTKATHVNYIWVNGVRTVGSTDWGLCQWNDYYHGKEITPQEAMNDPEKAVRLMCKYWKQGLMRQWVCYSAGMYKQFL